MTLQNAVLNARPRVALNLRQQIGVGAPLQFSGRRGGYVLLLVLVTLVIASTALIRIANLSLSENEKALRAVEALQSKWGTHACANTFLPLAGDLFEVLEDVDRGSAKEWRESLDAPKLWQFRDQIQLGGQRFELLLADENAKANLNAIQAAGGRRAVESAVRSLTNSMTARVALTSHTQVGSSESESLSSWGDVFDLADIRARNGNVRALAELTGRMTLWGAGVLNIHRASEEAIIAQCSSVVPVGRARRIAEAIKESKGVESAIVLQRTIENAEERAKLARLLGDGSNTYSIWIESLQDNGSREQSMIVRAVDQAGLVSTNRFLIQ